LRIGQAHTRHFPEFFPNPAQQSFACIVIAALTRQEELATRNTEGHLLRRDRERVLNEHVSAPLKRRSLSLD
jgi:hypothetical protein